MIYRLLLCILVLSSCMHSQIDAKLLVMTHAYNRPDFINIQYKTFKKFLHDDYEFVVFNDGRSSRDEQAINNICAQLGIRCIRIPQEIHSRPYLFRLPREDVQSPCCRCANVVQYSLNEYGFKHDGQVMIIDSDMFLVKDFSVTEYLQGYAWAGVDQERGGYHYLWNGLLFFDMRALPEKESIDFNCGELFGIPVDVGGQTYHYLQRHPEVKVLLLDEVNFTDLRCDNCKKKRMYGPCERLFKQPCQHNTVQLIQMGFDAPAISLIQKNIYNSQFLVHGHFFHYRSGQNWDGQSAKIHAQRTNILGNYIADILGE